MSSANTTNASIRMLHWVLKIGDRKANVNFFRQVLGMRALRHEEFGQGCEATCNGPYAGRWSKTMIGYGAEDDHFVLELTYNYDVPSYEFRHDFRGLHIKSRSVLERVNRSGYKCEQQQAKNILKILSPDGYPFFIQDDDDNEIQDSSAADPVKQISLAVSDLHVSKDFWINRLGLRLLDPEADEDKNRLLLTSGVGSASLELILNDERGAVDHGSAFGRVAFSCPSKMLPEIQRAVENAEGKGKVQTPLITLDTPGKASVQVVILTDPDGYEICFVGDEAFRQLSRVDENADRLLDEAIANNV